MCQGISSPDTRQAAYLSNVLRDVKEAKKERMTRHWSEWQKSKARRAEKPETRAHLHSLDHLVVALSLFGQLGLWTTAEHEHGQANTFDKHKKTNHVDLGFSALERKKAKEHRGQRGSRAAHEARAGLGGQLREMFCAIQRYYSI